jgi:hypothetical protein
VNDTTTAHTAHVAQAAVRHQVNGRPTHAAEALKELDIPELRRLSQACVAVTSAAAKRIVALAIEQKQASR